MKRAGEFLKQEIQRRLDFFQRRQKKEESMTTYDGVRAISLLRKSADVLQESGMIKGEENRVLPEKELLKVNKNTEVDLPTLLKCRNGIGVSIDFSKIRTGNFLVLDYSDGSGVRLFFGEKTKDLGLGLSASGGYADEVITGRDQNKEGAAYGFWKMEEEEALGLVNWIGRKARVIRA